MNTALIEATKAPLRLLLLALVGWLLTEGVLDMVLQALGITMSGEQKAVFFGIATIVLRWIDSILHEVAKEQPKVERKEGWLGVKGLTGF